MFHPLMTIFTALLFVALTPGILVTLPPKGSKLAVAVTHGLLFALIYHFTHKAVWEFTRNYESFQLVPRIMYEGFQTKLINPASPYLTSTAPNNPDGTAYVFPPTIKNGDICQTQTCMCNGAEIANKGRCQ